MVKIKRKVCRGLRGIGSGGGGGGGGDLSLHLHGMKTVSYK